MEKFISVKDLLTEVEAMQSKASSVNANFDAGFRAATSAIEGLTAIVPGKYFPDVIPCKDCLSYHPYGKSTTELVTWGKCMKINMDVDMPANGYSKYSRAYSLMLSGITIFSLVAYIAATLAGDREESTTLSSMFLIVLPIINLIGRGAERGSAKRETCYWVLIFVCAIAIAIRLFG